MSTRPSLRQNIQQSYPHHTMLDIPCKAEIILLLKVLRTWLGSVCRNSQISSGDARDKVSSMQVRQSALHTNLGCS